MYLPIMTCLEQKLFFSNYKNATSFDNKKEYLYINLDWFLKFVAKKYLMYFNSTDFLRFNLLYIIL